MRQVSLMTPRSSIVNVVSVYVLTILFLQRSKLTSCWVSNIAYFTSIYSQDILNIAYGKQPRTLYSYPLNYYIRNWHVEPMSTTRNIPNVLYNSSLSLIFYSASVDNRNNRVVCISLANMQKHRIYKFIIIVYYYNLHYHILHIVSFISLLIFYSYNFKYNLFLYFYKLNSR